MGRGPEAAILRAGTYVASMELGPRSPQSDRPHKDSWSADIRDIANGRGAISGVQYSSFVRALAVLRKRLGPQFEYRASPTIPWATVMGRSDKGEAVVFMRVNFIGVSYVAPGPPIVDFVAYSGKAARQRLEEDWWGWLNTSE